METVEAYAAVNERYSAIARTNSNTSQAEKIALSFGYTASELAEIPEGANLGVSCGNPLAIAGIKEGETVVDLGSGAGFDVFLAARKVGATGMAIGVDMSEDMLSRARLNATKSGITNVQFVFSPITAMTLASVSADVVISNCVINLVPAPEKHLVFQEMFRILKPGGRVAVSDVLARMELTENMRSNVALWVGCVSGASMVAEYEGWLRDSGFQDILIVDKKSDLNVFKETAIDQSSGSASTSGCCSSTTVTEPVDVMHPACCEPGVGNKAVAGAEIEVSNIDFNEWVGSFNIYAVKPQI